jgi:8-oxo-dGTP diphosphatase
MRTLFRVGAILFYNGKLVTTKMKKGSKEYHVVPGGGVEIHETIYDSLKRELQEELNIDILSFKLIYIRELNIENQGRGAEFYFYIDKYTGIPKKGFDPENKESVLDEVCFLDIKDLKNHTIFPTQLAKVIAEDYYNKFSEFRHLGLHNYP